MQPREEFFRLVYNGCTSRDKGKATILWNLAKGKNTPEDIILECCGYLCNEENFKKLPFHSPIQYEIQMLAPILKNRKLPQEGREMIETLIKKLRSEALNLK